MPFLTVDGARLHYRVHGAGSPVLIYNMTAGTADYWDAFQLPAFAKRHTVVTFDYRGVGQSEDVPERYTLELFADDGIAILRALGLGPAHVLGHSMGAKVAQHAFLRHRALVRSLVLSSGGCGQYDPAQSVPRGLPLEMAATIAEQGLAGFLRAQAASRFNWAPEGRERHAELVARYVQFHQDRLPAIRPYFKHVIARQEDDTTARLPELTCPTLLLAGEGETVVLGTTAMLPAAEYMAKHVPNAELFVVPGAAHLHFWQCPELVNGKVLGFWARVERA